jgi:Trypsin-co-occurring domain 2
MADEAEPTTSPAGRVDRSTAEGYQSYEDVYGKPPSQKTAVSLSVLLGQLADELRAAKLRGQQDDQEDIVRVKECSLEVGLTWEAEGTAGVKFWVFELGGSVSRATTQTLSVTLEPLAGRDIVFANMRPALRISEEDIIGRGLPTRDEESAEQ